jgi:hypothetical protein
MGSRVTTFRILNCKRLQCDEIDLVVAGQERDEQKGGRGLVSAQRGGHPPAEKMGPPSRLLTHPASGSPPVGLAAAHRGLRIWPAARDDNARCKPQAATAAARSYTA